MRSLVSLSRLSAVLALGFTTPILSQQSTATSVILGRVVEGLSDVAVADVLVKVRGSAAPYLRFSALTDANGNFVFVGLPAGSYAFTAEKTGHWGGEFGQRRAAGRGRDFVLADGQLVPNVTVPIWKFAAISGTVIDESGEPVVGLLVQAMTRSAATGGRNLVLNTSPQTARTDDRGLYRIYDLLPGDLIVAIPASELATLAPRSEPPSAAGDLAYPAMFYPGGSSAGGASILTVSSGEERGGIDFRIQMTRTRRVTGRVAGSAEPGGIAVRLTRPDESFLEDIVVAETVTRADGSFAYDRVVPGDYVLRVFEISGIAAQAAGGGGSFRAAGGPPPPASRPPRPDQNGWWAATPISVTDANLENVPVALQPARRISGHVVFNGAAPKLRTDQVARMLSTPMHPSGRRVTSTVRATTEVDEAFRFRTMELPAGPYLVRWPAGWPSNAWAIESILLGGRDALDQPIALGDRDIDGLVITLTDKVSEVGGTVRATDGTIDLDAAVLVFPADAAKRTDFGRDSPRLRSVRVNVDGAYSVKGLPAGDYLAVAVKDEFTDGWQAPSMLDRLARGAAKFTVAVGVKQTLDLRTSQMGPVR